MEKNNRHYNFTIFKSGHNSNFPVGAIFFTVPLLLIGHRRREARHIYSFGRRRFLLFAAGRVGSRHQFTSTAAAAAAVAEVGIGMILLQRTIRAIFLFLFRHGVSGWGLLGPEFFDLFGRCPIRMPMIPRQQVLFTVTRTIHHHTRGRGGREEMVLHQLGRKLPGSAFGHGGQY